MRRRLDRPKSSVRGSASSPGLGVRFYPSTFLINESKYAADMLELLVNAWYSTELQCLNEK